MILGMFEKAYYINLDSRTDRREQIEAELTKAEIEADRFPAIKPDQKGEFTSIGNNGRVQSHLAIIKKAKEQHLKNVLIFEDDCVLHPDINKIFPNIVIELKNIKWDIFMFYNVVPKMKVSNHISKLIRVHMSHCYAVNSSAYDKIIETLEKTKYPIDYTLNTCNFDVFCGHVGLAGQRHSNSDVKNSNFVWFPDGKMNFSNEQSITFVIQVTNHSEKQAKWCIDHLKEVYKGFPIYVLSEKDMSAFCSENNIKFVLGKPWNTLVDIWDETQTELVMLISPYMQANRKFGIIDRHMHIFGTKLDQSILDDNFIGMRYEFLQNISKFNTDGLDQTMLCKKVQIHPANFGEVLSIQIPPDIKLPHAMINYHCE